MDPSFCQNELYVSDAKLQLKNLGTKDIHLKRMRRSVMWSTCLQIGFLIIFIFSSHFNILHPISSMMNFFKFLLSVSIFLKLVLLSAVIYIQGEVCKKNYVNGPTYYTTRFQKMRHIFSVKNTLLLVFHIAIGLTIFWIYSSLLGGEYESLTRLCTDVYSENLNYCLLEHNLFLLLGGVWSGIYFFVIDYLFGSQNLSFPLIQQLKIYRIKSALFGNIKRSMKDSITPIVIFMFLYYSCGGYIRSKFEHLLSVRLDLEPLDSVKILMNIKLIFLLWLFSSIFIVAQQMMKLLFNVHLTEHCNFPVCTSMLPEDNYISLLDSLKPTNAPIAYYLGYLDLFTLSTKCQDRREEMFTLSQPGGHPHSWNAIYCESVNLIQKFTNDLNSALQQCSSSIKEPEIKLKKEEHQTGLNFHAHGIRKLASPLCTDENSKIVQRSMTQSWVEMAFNHSKSWWNARLDEFNKKTYIAYFFAEFPDSRIHYLLLQSQPVIWAVQSLAFLAAASLTEDRYGIVQRDLQDIIVAILNLKVSLDKLFKQNLIVRKTFANNDPLDVQMKFRLRTAVRRSIYRLAISFGPYIKDLKLPTDVELQMNNFIAFREML